MKNIIFFTHVLSSIFELRGETDKFVGWLWRCHATAAKLGRHTLNSIFSGTICIVSSYTFTFRQHIIQYFWKRQLLLKLLLKNKNKIKTAWKNWQKKCSFIMKMLLYTSLWLHNGCQINWIRRVINQFKATHSQAQWPLQPHTCMRAGEFSWWSSTTFVDFPGHFTWFSHNCFSKVPSLIHTPGFINNSKFIAIHPNHTPFSQIWWCCLIEEFYRRRQIQIQITVHCECYLNCVYGRNQQLVNWKMFPKTKITCTLSHWVTITHGRVLSLWWYTLLGSIHPILNVTLISLNQFTCFNVITIQFVSLIT